MIKSYSYFGLNSGPKVLVLGGIHGTEVCGTFAILETNKELLAGDLEISSGQLTLVPNSNPKAGALKKRYIDRNLNRDFREYVIPVSYEDNCANILCRLINEHDVVIDLHSYSSPCSEEMEEAFILTGCKTLVPHSYKATQLAAEFKLAQALAPSNIIHGWSTARSKITTKNLGEKNGEVLEGPSEGVGAAEYARFQGKLALTIECGRNDKKSTNNMAKVVIQNALNYFGMAPTSINLAKPGPHNILELFDGFIKKSKNDRLCRQFKHFDSINFGDPLIARESGRIEKASARGHVIMPSPNCSVGAEMLYIAKRD